MAKFNIGDEIYSEKNPFVKYRVVQVDIPKINKDPEYTLEDIWSRNKGKQYRMSINRVDKWGVLIVKEEPKKKTNKKGIVVPHSPMWKKCNEENGIKYLCFEGGIDTCLVWKGYYLSITELEKLLPKEK